MKLVLFVAAGGAVGSVLRYLVSLWLNRGAPWGTLAVNLVGSFLLAFLFASLPGEERTAWRVALGTGVLGGFTTYSTFNLEAFSMLERGEGLRALAYVGVTVLGALIAAWLGWVAGRSLSA